jgi:hypothetical protein
MLHHPGRILSVCLALALAACTKETTVVSPSESPVLPERPLFSNGSGPNGKYHYVKAVGGVTTGNGATEATAWTLPHAFSGAAGVLTPGDTVWLLGGDYTGTYQVTVAGASGAPIVFKQQPGQIANLKRDAQFTASTVTTLNVKPSAQWTEFRDFEIQPTTNIASRTAPTFGYKLPHPVWNQASNTKFVNLVLHDGGVAFLNDLDGAGTPVNVLISGNIIYNNGWDDTDRGHGHGLYLKNNSTTSPLTIADNIIFNQFGYGIHIYTDAGAGDQLNNIDAKGNVSFNNGTLSSHGTSANLGYLGAVNGSDLLFERNMLYFSPSSVLGFTPGRSLVYNNSGLTATGSTRSRNYIVGGNPFSVGGSSGEGWTTALSDSTATTPWTGTKVIVRQTAGDPNRANVVIYHGGSGGNASVDLSSFLNTNDSYEVRNAQAFRTVVTSGTYSGPISLPLGGVTPPNPNGTTPHEPVNTGPAFNVFVVIRSGGGPAADAASITGVPTFQGMQTTVVPATEQGTGARVCEYQVGVTNPAPGATVTVTWAGGSQVTGSGNPWIPTPFDGSTRTYVVRVDAPGRTPVFSPGLNITGHSSGHPVCVL